MFSIAGAGGGGEEKKDGCNILLSKAYDETMAVVTQNLS